MNPAFLLLSTILSSQVGPSEMPRPWVEPGFGNIIWVQSPHYGPRPPGTIVDTVVVHHTANNSLEGTTRWFLNPEARVSAHYTIGRDGSIVQHVSTFHRAWHAGVSRDVEGRENVNNFSVGIELVNIGDGTQDWPKEQTEALGYLISHLKRRFPLKYITSHKYIAQPPGRKPDPINFPWATVEGLGLKVVP
ncbi:MAG TPA: N-acetylmuramoyl-L-alanine amidase [Fimbriimonadaceae bacterium]|nr:N-acetylmuramoyl-L-alanine amidase [Fimbriimonadaceae bacterium]